MEMAVHAHYHPSSNLINLLHQHSDHQEGNNERMDLRFPHSVRKNLGKRSREDTMMAVPTSQFSGQLNHHSGLVSTGLCLSLDEQQQQQQHQFQVNCNSSSSVCSQFSSELADQIARHNIEIDQFLIQQGEQLRRELAEKRRRQYNVLLLAVEELIARKLREKQAEINGAAELTLSLESQLKQVQSESAAWQSKALADQATATTLHAQLQLQQQQQQVTAAPVQRPSWSSDAESGFVDPKRVEADWSCRACGVRAASVVVFPCRHLCLCEGCEGESSNKGDTCPVCCSVRTGSLKVFFQ